MRLLHETQVAAVNRAMHDLGAVRSLEMAPGPGRVTRDVRPAGELVCLEFNEGMIAEGQRCCSPHVKWVQGNAFELPFEDDEFDSAYSFRFVRHFHRNDRDRLYAQLSRVLRPGGWLVWMRLMPWSRRRCARRRPTLTRFTISCMQTKPRFSQSLWRTASRQSGLNPCSAGSRYNTRRRFCLGRVVGDCAAGQFAHWNGCAVVRRWSGSSPQGKNDC